MNRVQLKAIPLRGAVASGRSSTLPLLVRILPSAAQQVVRRPPLNLALVLDRSGSMSNGKMELAKEAACNLVSNLTPRDRVAVVAFDNMVTRVASSTPVTDVAALHRAIKGIHTGGNTALHQGWVEGGLEVGHHLSKETLSRVILLTDGQANEGECNPDVLASHARELASRGVSTTTMGIGEDYDERLLNAMARAGDGNFYHIQSSAQFEQFFGLELSGLANLVGGTVRLTLRPRTGVAVRVLNELDREQGNSKSGLLSRLLGRAETVGHETLVLPNMIAEVPIEVSMILTVDAVPSSGTLGMVDLRLAWVDPQGTSRDLSESFSLPVVSEADMRGYPENAEVAERIVLMEIATLKMEANELIRSRKLTEAASRLERARALVKESPQTPEMEAELSDLDYIQAFLRRGQYESVSKHSYYQSHQRSHSKTGYSSGRDTR